MFVRLSFGNWLAALYFLCRFLYSLWSLVGRRILLVKQAQVLYGAAKHLQILQPIENKHKLFL
jgi:hypothetical protein